MIMVRKFIAFNQETISGEFLEVPQPDRAKLMYAMQNYQADYGTGYTIKNYGDGLMMVKGTSSGRCLFFYSETMTTSTGTNLEILIAVLVYKKESQEVPARVLETAKERMRRYKEQS